MAQSFRRVARRAQVPLWAIFVAAVGLSGCKKASPAGGAGPAASGSAGADATGPCGSLASKMCDKAGGASSPTCESIKTVTGFLSADTCSTGLKDIDATYKKIASFNGVCEELTKQLCDAVGPKTQTCEMVTQQTKTFGPERCRAMGSHMPEVIAELKRMEEQNKPLSPELQSAIVKDAKATFGPADAKVQIVEFSDFQCPFCARAADTVHQVKAKYGDKVHFAFRQFPLPMHPNARAAAEAALAANTQGKFWELHDKMFQNQQQLDRPNLEQTAKAVGIDVGAFKKSLDSHEFASIIDADMKLGEQVHVNGTPTMFVNGARVADPTNFEALSKLIDDALAGKAPG